MLVDSMMIGRFLGVDSMTAYGLANPVLLIFAAYGAMLSAGIQVMCGKTMGAGDKEGTNACFSASAVLALGVVLIVEGLDVIKPTGNIAKFAKYSSLPNLSQIWMYLPVAIAGLGMVIFELEQVFLHIEEFFVPKTEKKEAQA
jgi:Na+-driven multidrug efflux pump